MVSAGELNASVRTYTGRCIGIKYDKLVVPPHDYSDGKPHFRNSDGLCPDCYRISELIRAQKKISKLEEKLNAQRPNGGVIRYGKEEKEEVGKISLLPFNGGEK